MQNQILSGISPTAVNPQPNYINIIQQLKQSMMNNMLQMLLLKNQGVITNDQALGFMDSINEMYKGNSMGINTSVHQDEKPVDFQAAIDFFAKDGRKEVLDYIKNSDVDKDEIPKIAKIVENIEKAAIDGYLKQSEHDKIKNDENTAAKSKLTSYAQNAKFDSNNNRIFTRADLGKMSDDEFAKNEKIIFEQLKQGLLQ
ncbi:MAG: hypothetical protein SPL73_06210 [Cyanobacteriota bacterium]|nr:hypothetical protein [Cyanobacteriota bacterium]MDY6358775.1 hypothetical protein [Cyanobacteriota bacterium]MDY6364466.1 hypothetical protein [Cyanobacteriota bacterium]MDY6383133.1 hypothetical protein [Cyanobacteriota bacterium]